ncbi:MAG TPA: M1 family metallopeptidase, partial [Thermoanaerobaculia bacterium]
MIRNRLVVLTLIALVAFPLCAADAPVRLGRDVVPVSQSITLKLDPRLDTYSGTTVVELDVKKAVPTFNLHSEEINIEKIAIDGVAATTAPGPEQTLVVTPGAPLKVGRAKLTIDFSNEYDRRAVGLYKMVRKDGEPYLFTQFQAVDARKAFPCWDEPIFKIPYQFTTAVPAQYQIVSNTPVEKETQADGWKTVQFKRTPPMPSYLLALAAGSLEFTNVPGTSIPTRIITTKGSSHLTGTAVEQTAPVLAALEKYFGTKYPYDKLDLIAVPEYWFGAMENPGLITYTETAILIDPKTGTPTQKRTNARYNSHEIAHMWFGDLVTMAWWDDLWLNESFADWLGDKIVNQVYPHYGLETQELGQVQGIMNTDASVLANPIRKRDVYPEAAMREVGLAYNKGKAVISMFEKWVGPEEFRKGVQRHMAKHAWGNATATDFYESISKSIVKPMATFIDQPGVPLISAELTGANEVKLTQSRYLRYGSKAEAETWIVPVALRYSDGKQTRTKTVLLDAPTKTFK